MPNTRLSYEKRQQVIEQWLLGTTRAQIGTVTGVSSGAISNILADYKRRLGDLDPEAIKDFVKELREHKISPSQCAIGYRIVQDIKEIGGDEENIASFIANIKKECMEKEVPLASIVPSLQAAIEFSEKEGMPVSELPSQVEKCRAKLANLRTEIEAAKAGKNKAIEDKNLTINAIEEHTKLNDRLGEVGMTTKDVEGVVNVVQNVKALGHDTKKITAQFSKIDSFACEELLHKRKIEELNKKARSYGETFSLVRRFRDIGFTFNDIDTIGDLIKDIKNKELLPSDEEAKRRLFTYFLRIKERAKLRQEARITGVFAKQMAEKREKYARTLPGGFEFALQILAEMFGELGVQNTRQLMVFVETVARDDYNGDLLRFSWDLMELHKERKRERNTGIIIQAKRGSAVNNSLAAASATDHSSLSLATPSSESSPAGHLIAEEGMKREFFVIPKAKFDEFKEALEQSADREIVHAEVDNDGIVVAIRGQER